MLNFNITPYNYWVLYAAIAAVVVSLLILAKKALAIPKAIKEFDPYTSRMQRNLQVMQIKTTAMNEKKQEDAKKNKLLKMALPVLLAIYEIYKKDDSMKGVKGFKDAALAYVNQGKADKALAKRLKKIM